MVRGPIASVGLVVLFASLVACAPQVNPTQVGGTESGAPVSRPKVLRIGMLKEPGNFIEPGSGGPSLLLDIADA